MNNLNIQIFTSPELRCLQTAAAIQHSYKNIPVYVDGALAEWSRYRAHPSTPRRWVPPESASFIFLYICCFIQFQPSENNTYEKKLFQVHNHSENFLANMGLEWAQL